eukprot:6958168-Pyramimonas_sp.AAC.1
MVVRRRVGRLLHDRLRLAHHALQPRRLGEYLHVQLLMRRLLRLRLRRIDRLDLGGNVGRRGGLGGRALGMGASRGPPIGGR